MSGMANDIVIGGGLFECTLDEVKLGAEGGGVDSVYLGKEFNVLLIKSDILGCDTDGMGGFTFGEVRIRIIGV